MTGASAARARALRRARAAAAPAEAERQARQRRVEAALAAYFEAAGQAQRIREAAAARAARIMAGAEDAAGHHDAGACQAIGQLRALGLVNAQIAGLCEISVPAVRAMAGRSRSLAREGPPGSTASGQRAMPPAWPGGMSTAGRSTRISP